MRNNDQGHEEDTHFQSGSCCEARQMPGIFLQVEK